MKLAAIVAVAENGVISSSSGESLWHLPADMKFFRDTTRGHTVIMGRKTYEAMGGPMKGCRSIIITRNPEFHAPGCEVVQSVEDALKLVQNEHDIFVIGGGEIYRQTLPYTDTLYITEVYAQPEGDVYFTFDKNDWREISRQDFAADETNYPAYSFVTYARK